MILLFSVFYFDIVVFYYDFLKLKSVINVYHDECKIYLSILLF